MLALAAVAGGVALMAAEHASALGQLTYGGCVSEDGSGGLCAPVNSPALSGPRSLVISRDGHSAYAAAQNGHAIVVFDRAADGQIAFAGCVSSTGTSGACADAPGTLLDGVSSVTISPDGGSVYAAAVNTVTAFDRAPGGQITYEGCVSDTGSGGLCADLPGAPLGIGAEVEVSPDGRSIYAAGNAAVTVFTRNGGGRLTYGGCVSNDGSGGLCADAPGDPFGGAALAISPDGHTVYVSGYATDTVAVLDRAPEGELTYGGCVSDTGSGGLCTDLPGTPLDIPIAISVAPDGSSLYVASFQRDAVTTLRRAAGGQLTYAGCISDTGSGGECADAPGTPLEGALGVATSPDGGSVYVAAVGANAVAVLDRAAGGRLTYASCISDTGSEGGCADAPGTPLTGVGDVVVSPDGSSVYAAGFQAGTVSHLSRKTAPQTTIDSGPAEGATVANSSPRFGFSADQAGAAFQCSLDGGTFRACSTPRQVGPLTNGKHAFAVRAITGGDRDRTPAVRRFRVSDTTPPRVRITRGPQVTLRSTNSTRKVTFAFVSSEPRSTFTCKLDGQPAARCTSPRTYRVRSGAHRFTVRATDIGRNTSQPARRSFRLVRVSRR